MEHNLIDLDNLTNYKPNLILLEKIIKDFSSSDIELIICKDDYIKEINYQYRGKDTPTDVLSFPFENDFNLDNIPLGSIIISLDFVVKKAVELKHSEDDEFVLLFIHGLLHLLGFDHEIDNGEHRKKEEDIVKKYNLPKSLIVRNN